MFKRVLFSTILTTGLFAALGANLRPDDPFPCPECGPGLAAVTTVAVANGLRPDDPFPCPECGPGRSEVELTALADGLLPDDPFPCPECGPGRSEIAKSVKIADKVLSSRA